MKTTINQAADNPSKARDSAINSLLAFYERLETECPRQVSKIAYDLNLAPDDQPFVPRKFINPRDMGDAPLVAEFADAYNSLQPSEKALFKARLKTAIENRLAGRAATLTPPTGSHTGHPKYFASLLRGETLEPPDPFEPGKFTPLNSIRYPDGNGTAGWCLWFADDSGGAFGRGRSADDLVFYRTPGEKTEAENRRFRQNIDAAHAALSADRQARRR